MIDFGLKLKCLRKHRGLSQKDLEKLSGVGEKTISSFETGQRLGALKVAQLLALLSALQVTLVEFVLWDPEDASAPANVAQPEESSLPAVVDLDSRRSLPVDPLAFVRTRDDSRYPAPQSSLARAM